MCNRMQLEKICTELHIQRPLHLFLLSVLHLPHCHHHQVPSQTTVKYFPLFKSSITQAVYHLYFVFQIFNIPLIYAGKYLFLYVLFSPLPLLVSLGKSKTAQFFFNFTQKKSPHPYLCNFKTRQNRFHV